MLNSTALPPFLIIRAVSLNLATALLYYLTALLTLKWLVFPETHFFPVWLPTGFMLCCLIASVYRVWPGVLLGTYFTIQELDGLPGDGGWESILVVLSAASMNTFSLLIGAWLLRLCIPLNYLRDRRYVVISFRFVCIAALTGFLTSCAGLILLASTEIISPLVIARYWFHWWLATVGGILLVAPVLFTFLLTPRPTKFLEHRRSIELFSLFGILLALGYIVFVQTTNTNLIVTQLLLPCLLWAAFRFTAREAIVATLLIATCAIYGALQGRGPLVAESEPMTLLVLQAYIVTFMLTMLGIIAALAERRFVEGKLQENNAMLEENVAARTVELTRINAELQGALERQAHTQAELDLFFNLSPSPFCISGGNGYLKKINPAFQTTLGYSHEELLGKPFWHFLHPDDLAANRDVYSRCSEGEVVLGHESRWRCKKGDYRLFSWNISAETSAGYSYAVARDITEDRRNWVELQNTKILLQGVLDTSLIAIMAFQSVRDESNKIVDFEWVLANKASGKTMGRPGVNWIGKHLLEEFPENAEDPELFEKYVHLVENGSPIMEEYVWPYSNPPQFFIRTMVKLGDGLALAFLNITSRKKMETEKERLIEELERFTYTVSHDLKSPLITIRGFLGYLKKDIAAGKLDRVDKDIAQIDSATEKMQALLADLLELSRIGRLMNPPEILSLREIVNEAATLSEGRLTEHHVTLKIEGDMPLVSVDRKRMVEVFQNLLDNAAKFIGEQVKPVVTVRCCSQHDGQVICCVRDNGIGIEPDYHDKVFALFERLDAETEGTGIGLALVKRIIETHGGKIWLESSGKGQGTAFYFTLPMAAHPN